MGEGVRGRLWDWRKSLGELGDFLLAFCSAWDYGEGMNTNHGSEEWAVGMTGLQYEALCRHAVSRIYGVPVAEIHGGHVAAVSKRTTKLRHQIDLYWTASDGVCEYKVFANARWRTRKLDMGDMMELLGVWRDIGVHKAMLITNNGFELGVKKQAEDKGIALLIVRPRVDFSFL